MNMVSVADADFNTKLKRAAAELSPDPEQRQMPVEVLADVITGTRYLVQILAVVNVKDGVPIAEVRPYAFKSTGSALRGAFGPGRVVVKA